MNLNIKNIILIMCGLILSGCGAAKSDIDSLKATTKLAPNNRGNLIPGKEQTINLSYNLNGNLGEACEVTATENITSTGACICDVSGECSVAITPDSTGDASLAYIVTGGGLTADVAVVEAPVKKVVPFVFKMNVASGTEYTLGLTDGFKYDFTIDWGDGSDIVSVTSFNDDNRSYTYGSSGIMTVTISGLVEKLKVPSNITEVVDLGRVGWTSLNSMFSGCMKLTSVAGGDTSSVKDMSNVFALTSFSTPMVVDAGTWDTSRVETMEGLFNASQKATLLNSSHFNTSKVTNMSSMFKQAHNVEPETEAWDTSKVTDMSEMFKGASSADPNTSNWNTSKVENFEGMFMYTFGRFFSGDPDVSKWDTSSANNMKEMFFGATNANPDVSNWNTSNVTDMSYMFTNASNADPDISNWDVSKVTTFSHMFSYSSLSNRDFTQWHTSSAEDMSFMFSYSPATDLNLSSFDVSNVSTMVHMFSNTSLDLDLSSWNFSSVTDMQDFFTAGDLSKANYDKLLVRLEETVTTSDVELGVGTTQYTSGGDAAAAVSVLETLNWAITDGGPI